MRPKTGGKSFVRPVPRQGGGPSAVFLVGFMGAGKTSVGKILSRRLGWAFEDLDDRIQAREGRSIESIFRDFGEAEFRRAEGAALRELLAEMGSSPRIVALGGGAFVQPENAELLEKAAVPVLFLDGSAEELFRRCEDEQRERPLKQNPKQFRELYDQRRPSYLRAAWRIDTDGKDLNSVAEEVACSLGLG
jgi:shikimate kinase